MFVFPVADLAFEKQLQCIMDLTFETLMVHHCLCKTLSEMSFTYLLLRPSYDSLLLHIYMGHKVIYIL